MNGQKNKLYRQGRRGIRVLFFAVLLLAVLMLFSTSVLAVEGEQSEPVAKVGNTGYGTIDEAVANWTPNTTLTLLADVTLSGPITFNSNEAARTLSLGEYMMRAADGQHAIVIKSSSRNNASQCLYVNASTNADGKTGGITAEGKSCIYYSKPFGVKDRSIIQINGGVFEGDYSLNITSNGNTTCTQVWINGGTFNSPISLKKCLLIVKGGVYNTAVSCTGDTNAYRLISGGRFESMTMTSDNIGGNIKFSFGTAKGNYDKGLYVDADNYLVVGGDPITSADGFEAYTTYTGWTKAKPVDFDYPVPLYYSSANANGLYWKDIDDAVSEQPSGEITAYVSTLDLTGSAFTGTLLLPDTDSTLAVTFAEGTVPGWSVSTNLEGMAAVYNESIADGVVTRNYYVAEKPTADDFNYALTTADLTYDGQPKAATVSVKNSITGMGNVTVQYFMEGVAEPISGEPVDAGTYVVKIDTEQTDKFAAADDLEVGSFTIEPKALTANWVDGDVVFTYDGTEKFPEYTVTGIVPGESVELVRDGVATDADEYTAKLTGVHENTNYTLSPVADKVFEIQKASQSAPVVNPVAETISKKSDGKITGVTDKMEYRTDGENAYIAISGETVEGLEPGTYYVHYKADYNHDASLDTEVVIAAGRKLHFTLPQNPVGYTVSTSVSEYDYNASANVTFTLLDGYSKTEGFKLMCNGEVQVLTDGTLALSNITEDIEITVEGVADVTAPTVSIALQENKWDSFLSGISFGLFFNETQEVTVAAQDAGSGIHTVEYYLSDEELTEEEVKTVTEWEAYSGMFKIDPNNQYVVYAKVADKAGNVTYVNSTGLVLDSVAPVLENIETGKTYYGDLTVIKPEAQFHTIESVSLDGSSMDFAEGTYGLIPADNKEHTVIVTDLAGNSTTYVVKVMKNYTVTFKADGEVVKTETVGHGTDAVLPKIPAKEGFNETAPKWDKDGKNITADTVITAVYTKNEPGEIEITVPETNFGGGKLTDTAEELEEKLPFTERDKEQIALGDDVEVWIEIEDISKNVPTEDKKLIDEKLGDSTAALYLDISMFMQIGDEKAVELTELEKATEITIVLPDSLINKDKNVERTYSIIHVHEGKTEIIKPTFNEEKKTLTFMADDFSNYSVTYTDKVKSTASTGEPEESAKPTATPAPTEKSDKDTAPATGDSMNFPMWMLLMMLGTAALYGLNAYRKRAEK